MPTAIFFVITYLLFGIFATIVVNNDFIANIGDVIGKYVGNVILTAVIPLQNSCSRKSVRSKLNRIAKMPCWAIHIPAALP